MGCSEILLIPIFLVMLVLRACTHSGASEPEYVGYAPGLVGEWQMLGNEAFYGDEYSKGKSLVLHADGRVECHNLQRRDLEGVLAEPCEEPLPQQGTWTLVVGKSPAPSTLVLNFGEKLELCGKFYRSDGLFQFGELELWFRHSDDPDVLLWTRFGRPKMEAVRVQASELEGEWLMTRHDCSTDLQYGKGKRLVLHADGRAECHGLRNFDVDWLNEDDEGASTPVPAQARWELVEHNGTHAPQTIRLWCRAEHYVSAQVYAAEGETEMELRFDLSLEPFHKAQVCFRRAVEQAAD